MPVVDSANRLRVVDESSEIKAVETATEATQAAAETIAGAVSGSEVLIAGGATQANDVKVTLDSETVSLASGSELIGKIQPFAGITEIGATEIIGSGGTVEQNQYAASATVSLATPGAVHSGEILAMALYVTAPGTGAIITTTGKVFLFDEDPAIDIGDTAITETEWKTAVAVLDVADAD